MKIIIDPQWSFINALDAAWDAYPGGRELGVPNRIRVLEQWANVVGCERAISEFETVLKEHRTLGEASEHLGLSLYAIKKLRKRFGEMPAVTPFTSRNSNSQKLPNQLVLLPEEQNSTNLTEIALTQFLESSQKVEINPLSKLLETLTQKHIAPIINGKILQQFIEISEKAGVDVVDRLVDWIAKTAKIKDVVTTCISLFAIPG
ncbi:MAG: hypothetical protein GY801_16160 [bacterium]|nr:hypothetical protein [bacterium]